MKSPVRISSKLIAAVAGMMLAAGVGILLYEYRFGEGLVRGSYDLLHVWRGDLKVDEAVVVYMDDESHLKLNQLHNAAWDRSLHAQLIDTLTASGARAIVFDIVFSDPNKSDPAGDERLANAMKQSGRVILAADNVQAGPKETRMIRPFDLLMDSAAGIGSAEVMADADVVVRTHTPEEQLPALSWAAAEFIGAKAVQQGVGNQTRWLHYYGPPNVLPWMHYHEAITRGTNEFFRDKVVFVGARILTKFAGDRKDEYKSPFSAWLPPEVQEQNRALFMAGVEIQATAFANLARGDWLSRWPRSAELSLLIALGLLFGFGLVRFHPVWATVVAVAGLCACIAFSFILFSRAQVWFPWLIISAQIGLALSWSILFNSIQLYVQKRLLEQTLRVYLPPKLVKKFVSSPGKSAEFLKPGAVKQTLTLCFTDIADFTSMSEGLDSDELATMMNNYFETAVSKCIHKSDGTVAKYIGDAIFAFWNAPDEQPDHALRACEAALLFSEEATQPIHGRHLRTRIGLHTGVANVGNFGSEQRVDYTALGENVNLASRMEGLNKHLGTHCLMSGVTKATVKDLVLTRALGSFRLKGFESLVEVHELVGRTSQAAETRAWREAFAEALQNYEQRNLEFAELGFRRVLELRPEDGPSKFYLERITELSREALPDNWATYTILKEK